jgi:hypothetical protein
MKLDAMIMHSRNVNAVPNATNSKGLTAGRLLGGSG